MINNAYEEVYEILSYMDKSTVMKIPENILKKIKSERNRSFKTKIDKKDIFNQENICEEAVNLLCWLDYNYWMDEARKNEIKKLIGMKEIEIESEKSKKYNPNKLFRNIEANDKTLKKDEEIAIYKESKIRQFWNKVLWIFK